MNHNPTESVKETNLFKLVRPYTQASYAKAFWQLGPSLLLYIPMIFILLWSLEVSYWLTLLLILPTAYFSQRLFVIQHDCGHRSFLPKKWQNDLLGTLLSFFSFAPYRYWAVQHDIHHQTNGNLDRRGTGDVITWTVEEYKEATIFKKIIYRVYRNPYFFFSVLAPLHFLVLQRIPLGPQGRTWEGWISAMITNIGVSAVLIGGYYWIGLERLLLIHLPVIYLNCVCSVWLFYVQHQFDGTYWQRDKNWNYEEAAMGCSFYDMPKFLHWSTANIGYHHIHHLNACIPNYNLARCHYENPVLQEVVHLSLKDAFSCANLALWDETKGKLISFSELPAHTQNFVGNPT